MVIIWRTVTVVLIWNLGDIQTSYKAQLLSQVSTKIFYFSWRYQRVNQSFSGFPFLFHVRWLGDRMNLSELIFSIKNRDIVVPEFQREYVWPYSNAKELLKSLINGFQLVAFWLENVYTTSTKGMPEEGQDYSKIYQVLLMKSNGWQLFTAGDWEIPPVQWRRAISRRNHSVSISKQENCIFFQEACRRYKLAAWPTDAAKVSWPEIINVAINR